MSQNPRNPYEQAYAPLAADAPSNPYMGTQAAPDLDAAAPSLRNDEQQRVNRKALVFLGGIVLLLALMAVVVFKSATGRDAPEKPAEEQVRIPTLSDAGTPPLPQAAAMAPPIEVQPIGQEPLPPLPAQPVYETSTMPPPAPGLAVPRETYRQRSLMERRMGADPQAGGMGGTGQPNNAYAQAVAMTQAALGGQAGARPDEAPAGDTRRTTSARVLRNPDALLVRGTLLRCVLSTRIVSEADGFTSCALTEPVYSINGRHLLLPSGSKIYGSYRARPKGNRVEVVWDRVTTPDNVDVSMSSPGVDGLGGAGVPGHLDSHWAARITSAVMVSLLSDVFKYAAAENGPSSATVSQGVVVVSPFESNTARTLDRIANQAAEAAMSRPPTVTIHQGTLLNVYVARDIDFSEVLGR
ncbi:MAG TPA: TrbI/VirB10 family protein [Lysobacter sp.]